MDKVNGQINVIHEDGLELTEFMGRFSPFNLNELEMKVCRLVDQNEDKDDFPEPQQAPQAQDSDSNSGLHSIEDITGMDFNSPHYSPIPSVRDAAPQQPRVLRPTSMPITDRELGLNMTDPTHNRGKIKIVKSLLEPVILHKKSSKGGKVKHSQGIQPRNQPQPSTSSQVMGTTWRPVVYCSACGGDHLHKDCHCETFCIKCRSSSHDTEMCPHTYKV